jgi:serine/threonine protein kinase
MEVRQAAYMSPERFQQIRDVFERAVEVAPEHRRDFVARCCGEDRELADDVQRMLAADPGPAGKSETSQENEAVSLGFPPGTILARRYRIVSLLGQGGMGEVYRADDLLLGQPVALKFLPRKASADTALLAKFRNEVRIARQVTHPNVCRVHDIGEVDGLTYLTMEYVDGEDLGSLLRRIGKLPHDKALEVAGKLCAGLAAAHEKGVIHRDLKPANIMLDGKGQVRITDFGLAGVAEQIRDVRSGTPAYMAPEQRAGKEVTPRSDIYTLGMVLYELFTGKRASRESKNAELDPIVEPVILRCLEEDPRMRPATALSVAVALSAHKTLPPEIAALESKQESGSGRLADKHHAPRTGRGKRRYVFLAAASAALSIAGVAVWRSFAPAINPPALTRIPLTSYLGSEQNDSVQILSISPSTDNALRVGETVTFHVEVEYNLSSANSGSVTLVIQQAESGRPPLANEIEVIMKGRARVVLTKDVRIPETRALQVFTPLNVRGGTSTRVVDNRMYKVLR